MAISDPGHFPGLVFRCPEGEVVREPAAPADGGRYLGADYVIRLRSPAQLKDAVGIYPRGHRIETVRTSHPECFRLLRRAR